MTATAESYVILCTGMDGAYGPVRPVGSYLVSFDPNAVDPTGEFQGLVTWSTSIKDALRFRSEGEAHGCIEAGLAALFRMRIVPVAPPAPAFDLLAEMRADGTL